MKKHYAILESSANESDNNDYWSDSVCGLEIENVTNNWEYVSCKKCLKRKETHEHEMKEAMEHNIRDMAGFVEFMEGQNEKDIKIN